MQGAEDGVVSMRSWAMLSLRNCLCRSVLKGYEEKMVGLSKARGKGVRIGRRRTDKICLPMRMEWKWCYKVSFTDFAQHLSRDKPETVPGKAAAPLKAYRKRVGEISSEGVWTLERSNETSSACGECKLTSWHLWGAWNLDKNFNLMGRSQSIHLSRVCLGDWTEFVFVEDKRRMGREDVSQIAGMGPADDRQKNVGGRTLGEQNSGENYTEGRWELEKYRKKNWHQCWLDILHLEWMSLALLVCRKWMLSWEGNSGGALNRTQGTRGGAE